MGSDSSPAPEIGGADLPPSSPEARGLSSSAGSSTSDAAASGSAPRPSSRTTRNLLGGDLSVLHGDAVRDSSHERTSLTLLGPRLDSPRDSTAEGGVVPVLGSRAQITYPTPTLPLLPRRYQEAGGPQRRRKLQRRDSWSRFVTVGGRRALLPRRRHLLPLPPRVDAPSERLFGGVHGRRAAGRC